MTGRYIKFLFAGLLVLLAFTFFSVPFGESSGTFDIDEGGTETPQPTPQIITKFSPVPPIDVSHLSSEPVRLTRGGCCSYAGWSADSEWILFLDGKEDRLTTGLYTVPREGGVATRLTNSFGVFSRDWSHVAYPEDGVAYVERWADRTRWSIPSSGRKVSIAPDLSRLAWEFGSQRIQSPDRRQSQIWVANINGQSPRELVTIHGGSMHAWVGGGNSILVSGRLSPPDPAGIWKVDTNTGAALLLFEVEHPRSLTVSASGEWLAFIVAFEQDSRRNGIWVLKTDGSFTQRLLGFGAYRWRADAQLLLIPLDLGADHPGLYQIDIEKGRVWRLIDPEEISLEIANNDWSVSPDGNWLLFQSSLDRNLWTMELPELPELPEAP